MLQRRLHGFVNLHGVRQSAQGARPRTVEGGATTEHHPSRKPRGFDVPWLRPGALADVHHRGISTMMLGPRCRCR